MALIPAGYLNAVVAIGVGDVPERRKWIGTGFVYGQFLSCGSGESKNYRIFLITNSHVLQDQSKIWLKFNQLRGQGSTDYYVVLRDENGQENWSRHSDSDVAAFSIDLHLLRRAGHEPGIFRSDENVARVQDLIAYGATEGDGVFLLGFPMGLVDSTRQYVVCRRGCLARIRDVLDGSRQDFLVDALVFPGNSGSPVLSKPEMVAIQGTRRTGKCQLIGIVTSYVPYRDRAVSSQTGRLRVVFEENSGLAAVVPVDVIEEVARQELRRIEELEGERDG